MQREGKNKIALNPMILNPSVVFIVHIPMPEYTRRTFIMLGFFLKLI